MRKRYRPNLNSLSWDLRSCHWSQGRPQRTENMGSSLWMCAEDISNRIWGQFHRVDKDQSDPTTQSVWIDGCSKELLEVFGQCLPNGHRDGFSHSVEDFVKSVAQELILKGEARFEFSIGRDHVKPDCKPVAARVVWVQPESLFRVFRLIYQVIPPGVVESFPRGGIIKLDSERLAQFHPPEKWDRKLRTIRSGLPLLWSSLHQWMGSCIDPQSINEDHGAVKRSYDVRMAKLVAPIGWNARELVNNEMSSMHHDLRELRMQRFCIELRDGILIQLGELFKKIGGFWGESPILRWDYLPTTASLDEAFFKLIEGQE